MSVALSGLPGFAVEILASESIAMPGRRGDGRTHVCCLSECACKPSFVRVEKRLVAKHGCTVPRGR